MVLILERVVLRKPDLIMMDVLQHKLHSSSYTFNQHVAIHSWSMMYTPLCKQPMLQQTCSKHIEPSEH